MRGKHLPTRRLSHEEREIHRLADAEFVLAKKRWYQFLAVQLLVAALTFFALIVTSHIPLVICTLLMLALQAVAWYAQWRASVCKAQANRGHRMLQILFGLGAGILQQDIAELIEGFSTSPSKLPESQPESYFFHCAERPSHIALLRCVQETGFYLQKLYRRCGKLFSFLVAFVLIALFFVLLISSFLAPVLPDLPVILAKLVVVALNLVVAADLLGLTIAYFTVSGVLREIDGRIERLCKELDFDADGNTKSGLGDIIYVLLDFYAAEEQAPLIPVFIHQRYRQELSDAWKERPHHQNPRTQPDVDPG
jgi:hypothetical protein